MRKTPNVTKINSLNAGEVLQKELSFAVHYK